MVKKEEEINFSAFFGGGPAYFAISFNVYKIYLRKKK